MKMKKKILSAAVTAVLGAGSAQAVTLTKDGQGGLLLFPYYTVQGNNETLVTITNVTDKGKAVKVRFRQASLRSRERFWDIRVPKIDSIFDNSLVPRTSWSPGVPPQHRKLVAATHRPPI